MSPEQKSSVREVVELFDEAERKVKEVEQFAQELSIPSINELRYVGYHIARAISQEDAGENGIDEQIDKAKRHCQRAIYDAHEIGMIHMLEKIRYFKESYQKSSHVIVEFIPDYTQILSNVDKAAELIATVKNGHSEDRSTYYEECKPHYLRLWEVCLQFDQATPLIDQKIEQNLKDEQKETRRFVTTALLSTLGIVVSVVVGATIIYMNFSTTT